MDNLFYPFYMEDCRHDFVNNVLKFNIDDNARNGVKKLETYSKLLAIIVTSKRLRWVSKGFVYSD